MARVPHSVVVHAVNRQSPVPAVIVYGRHVATSMTGVAWFSGMSAVLTTFATDIDALETAEAAAKKKTLGAAAARNTKLRKVHSDLDAIKSGIQAIIDANPDQAAEIASAAGAGLRKHGVRVKPELAARMMPTPGSVKLTARRVKKGASYEWQYSTDGKTWLSAGSSTVANQIVAGLVAGTAYLFRFRATVGHTTADWSQTLAFIAH